MKTRESLLKHILFMPLIVLLSFSVSEVMAKATKDEIVLKQGYELHYLEREPGIEDYELIMLVSDRYIRIDEIGDDSGYIVYDDVKKAIYSVSIENESVLLIDEHKFTDKDSPAKFDVEYLQLSDAPAVSGNKVLNYRVYTGEGDTEETCMEIQLVENLMPDVRKILMNYQKIVSGQQVKMVDNKITDVQTACYFIDQIYNSGAYYEKGLPIQEWHNNERSKILKNFKKVTVNKSKFYVPENYRQFSIDKNSKTFIK